MILNNSSRESGIEFSVGLLLLALGIGMFIPRPGIGLYSVIRDGGDAQLWGVVLNGGALMLITGSFLRAPLFRISAVGLSILCWIALALKFIDAQLWGAVLQATFSIFLLNACGWRLFYFMRAQHA